MGLDSVLLIMEHEKFFGVQFQDNSLEHVKTVQEMVDVVAATLGITAEGSELRTTMDARLRAALITVGVAAEAITPKVPILQLLPSEHVVQWQQLCEALQLTVPLIFDPGHSPRGILRKWFDKLAQRTVAPNAYCSYQDFVDAVCITNYKALISRDALRDKYEIYVAVGGITVDCLGIEVFEVRPEARFANDFGMG